MVITNLLYAYSKQFWKGGQRQMCKALEIADTRKDYEPLYEIIFKVILRCSAELSSNCI